VRTLYSRSHLFNSKSNSNPNPNPNPTNPTNPTDPVMGLKYDIAGLTDRCRTH